MPQPQATPDDGDATTREKKRCARFGWTWLSIAAAGGFVIETAHGFKLAAYVDDDLTRALLRLAHAHAAGLSLVVLIYGAAGVDLYGPQVAGAKATGTLLRFAALLVPVGFAGGAFHHPEGDPSVFIFLVPLGAVVLLVGLGRIALRAWR